MARINVFSLSGRLTLFILISAAGAFVLGILDRFLGWAILGPDGKDVFKGIFLSLSGLGLFGLAITAVLGLGELVRCLKKLLFHADESPRPPAFEFSIESPLVQIGIFCGFFCALAVGLHFADRHIKAGADRSFKNSAAVRLEEIRVPLSQALTDIRMDEYTEFPEQIRAIVQSTGNLPYAKKTILYLPDPNVESFMWRYSLDSGPERFFVSGIEDKAIYNALRGEENGIEELNAKQPFVYYFAVSPTRSATLGIVKVCGSPHEKKDRRS